MDMPLMPLPLPAKVSGNGSLAGAVKDLPSEIKEELAQGGDFWANLRAHLRELHPELPEDLSPDQLMAMMGGADEGEGLFAMLSALQGGGLPEAGQILPLAGGEAGRSGVLAAAMAQVLHGNGNAGQAPSLEALLARGAGQGEGFGKELIAAVAGETPLPTPAGAQQTHGLRLMTLDVPMSQPSWNEAMGNRVMWMVNQNVQGAELRLNPPHLGPLEIRVSMEGDRAHVQFLAAHATTRDTLDAAIPRLREMLAESGVQLGDVDVSHREAGGDSGGSGEGSAGGGAGVEGTGGEEGSEGRMLPGQQSGLLDAYA